MAAEPNLELCAIHETLVGIERTTSIVKHPLVSKTFAVHCASIVSSFLAIRKAVRFAAAQG